MDLYSTPKKTDDRKDNETTSSVIIIVIMLSVYTDVLCTLVTLKFISRPS